MASGISLMLWLLEQQQAGKRGQAKSGQMSLMGDILGVPERGQRVPPPTMPPGPQLRGTQGPLHLDYLKDDSQVTSLHSYLSYSKWAKP